ncbi:flagellar hook-basal body complex protein [Lachnospiraceae bacterium 54-53]
MVKSMFAGVAGLRTHQSKMDVIGNNIANVNTWGYKAGSMSFKDTMYQSTSSGSAGSTDTGGYGGTNANQIGYGVTTGSISYDFSTGGMSPSARGLDCMIDGTGFFIVGPMISGDSLSLDDENAIRSSGLYLSRVGKFDVDSNGYLVDDSGNYVYGFVNNGDLTSNSDFDTTVLAPLKIPTSEDLAGVGDKNATDKVAAAKKALEEARANLNSLNVSLGTAREEYIAANSVYEKAYADAGIDTLTEDLKTLKDTMETAYADWLDNKDDATLKTAYYDAKLAYDKKNYELIRAQAEVRAPEALKTYTTADLDAAMTQYETDFNAYAASDPSTDLDYETKKTAYETAKKALETIQTALTKIEDKSPEGLRDSANQAVEKAKAMVTAAETTVSNAEKNLAAAQKSATDTSTNNAGADDTVAELTNYKVQEDGTLVGTTSGGSTIFIGKIALAGVQNTSGLEKDTGYYYSIGVNAGNVGVYEAGGTQGRILGNYLEMAKVDLATEMTDMITTQRGFQANSKIITVTDQMLEELVNMKR